MRQIVTRDTPGPLRAGRDALLLAAVCLVVAPGGAQENLRSGMIYYTDTAGAGEEMNARIAQRYELGITGLEIAGNATAVKLVNPDFQWFVYNSATDNYVGSEEDALVTTIAAGRGWDPEAAYLHYYDDTRIALQGDTIRVPGWGGGTAASEAEARVPVYYADLSRRAADFATPKARRIHAEVILALSVDRRFNGTDLHPDGIFLDNATAELYNFGEVLDGGHVLEAPAQARIDSREFRDWRWNVGFGPFLTELEDTLRTSAAWSRDGRRKYLMNNIANTWTDDYVTRQVADILFMEFQYDPVRNPDAYAVHEAWERDRDAAGAGIRSFYAPVMKTSPYPYSGRIAFADAMLGSLAWYLTTRTEQSLVFLFGTANPATAGWDTLTWRGCVDTARDRLGPALGEPYVFAEGTDPTGKSYRVWARDYDAGLVLVRNRGRWDEDIEPETAVSLALPAPLALIEPSGAIGAPISTISLRNGTGAILLDVPPTPPENPVLRISFPDPYLPNQPMQLEPGPGGMAEATILDIAGRRVRTLHSGPLGRTVKELCWDGRTDGGGRVGSGLYYLDVRVGDAHIGRSVVFVK